MRQQIQSREIIAIVIAKPSQGKFKAVFKMAISVRSKV